MADSVQTLEDAYEFIGIRDTSMPDGDVAVAFYRAYSDQRQTFNGNTFGPIKSLDVIADGRQSQLLAFVRAMIPHLTEEKVGILATKTTPGRTTESSTIAQVEAILDEPGSQFPKILNSPVHALPDPLTFGPAANPSPSRHQPTTVVDPSDSDDTIASDQPEEASNFSSDFSSNDFLSLDESNTSETSEPTGGKFWNGESWCCKVCKEELDEEGKCEDGHTINPCRYCGKDFEPFHCPRFCIECHSDLPRPCSICNKDEATDEDESIEAIQMVWDDRDDVWRCTTCMWEVEANSENEGQCHCTADPEVSPRPLPLCGLIE